MKAAALAPSAKSESHSAQQVPSGPEFAPALQAENPIWLKLATGGGLSRFGAGDPGPFSDDATSSPDLPDVSLASVGLTMVWPKCSGCATEEEDKPQAPSEPVSAQRACAACEEEESIQPSADDHWHGQMRPDGGALSESSLRIGQPGDPYEQEADRVADIVVATSSAGMSGSFAPPSAATSVNAPSVSFVQRDPEESEEAVGEEGSMTESEPLTESPEPGSEGDDETEGPELQCKHSRNPSPSASIATELHRRRGSGNALPTETRAFMESRFGSDFSRVRVHDDSGAGRLARRLGAYAFTTGADIYFAPGQFRPGTHEGTRLLAHELTHVVQQQGGLPAAPMPFVQRSITVENKRYYGRYRSPNFPTGTVIHHRVEERLSAANPHLITEAPIPGAISSRQAPNVIGSADLYESDGSKTPDLRADYRESRGGALTFWPLTASRKHKTRPSGRPVWSPGALRPSATQTARIEPRQDFPSTFRVADLKPLSLGLLSGGFLQIDNYQHGMGTFAGHVHAVSGGTTHVTPRGSALTSINIPPAMDYSHFNPDHPDQPTGGLVIGHYRFWLHNFGNGLISYFDIATEAPSRRQLADYNQLIRQMQDLRRTLRTGHPPISNNSGISPKMRPGIRPLPASALMPIRRRPVVAVQRDINWRERGRQWEQTRRAWARRSRTFVRGTGRQLARRMEIDRRLGIHRPVPRGQRGSDQAAEFRSLRFWSSRLGQLVGRIRFLLGNSFDAIARRFRRFRQRFRGWHARARSMVGQSPGGGWRRTLVRVILRALQIALSRLMSESFRIFADCVNGLINKAIRMVTEEASANVREQVCNLHRGFDSFKDMIEEEFESRFGPIENFVDAARTVGRIVQIATTLVTLIRLGFQAVACLSPPALGCLWGLIGQVAIEVMLDLIIGTEWFENNIVRHASIREFLLSAVGPQYQALINAALDRAGLRGFASDVSECQLQIPELGGLLGGERPLSGAALEGHRGAWEGRHRSEMMGDLRREFSGADGHPATERELRRLLEEANRRHLSGDQLREILESNRGTDGRVSVPESERAIAPPAAEDEPESTAPPPPQPEEPARSISGTEPPEPGTGGSGGILVADASSRRLEGGVSHGDVEGATAWLARGRLSHTVGTEVLVDVIAAMDGQPVEMIRDVPARVVRRIFEPEGSTADTAVYLFITYELQQGIRFERIPHGGLERGRRMNARVQWRASRPASH